MAKPTKEQVDALKLKRMQAKYSKPAKAAKKKQTLDATKKKSDATAGGAVKAIKKRHKMLHDI